jgi:hypothetical protein
MWLFSSPAGVIILVGIIYGIWKLATELDTQTYASQYKRYADEQMEYNALHFDERCEEIMRRRKEKFRTQNDNK